MKKSLLIGLTGGIGSGKTTLSNYFQTLDIEIFDADIIARQLVEPNKPLYHAIIERMGTDILSKDQTLNRQKIANIIFNDPSEKTWLEECLHPPVYHQLRQLSAKAKSPYHIWSVPLLIETGAYQEVDRVLVVDAPEMQQIERIQERASMTVDQVYAIISTQVSREQRLSLADDVITNDSNLNNLYAQANQLHHIYLQLSAHQK